jgi:hypothetical protein
MTGTRRRVLMAAAISIASASGPDVARSAEPQTPTSRNVSTDTLPGLDTDPPSEHHPWQVKGLRH